MSKKRTCHRQLLPFFVPAQDLVVNAQPAGRSPGLRICACLRLPGLPVALCSRLPAYSDEFVQDLHLFPFSSDQDRSHGPSDTCSLIFGFMAYSSISAGGAQAWILRPAGRQGVSMISFLCFRPCPLRALPRSFPQQGRAPLQLVSPLKRFLLQVPLLQRSLLRAHQS